MTVNKPFKGYVREVYDNFMIGYPENRKVGGRTLFRRYILDGKI